MARMIAGFLPMLLLSMSCCIVSAEDSATWASLPGSLAGPLGSANSNVHQGSSSKFKQIVAILVPDPVSQYGVVSQAENGDTSATTSLNLGPDFEEFQLFLKNCPAFAAVQGEQFLTDRQIDTICLQFENEEDCANDEIAPKMLLGLCGEKQFLESCTEFAKFVEESEPPFSPFMTSLEIENICSEFKNEEACADDPLAQLVLSQLCADWSPTFEVCDNLRGYVENQGCFDIDEKETKKILFVCNEPSSDDLNSICEDFKIQACADDLLFSSSFAYQCQGNLANARFFKNCPTFAASIRDDPYYENPELTEAICNEFNDVPECANDDTARQVIPQICANLANARFFKNCPKTAAAILRGDDLYQLPETRTTICYEFKNVDLCANDELAQDALSQLCADWRPTFNVCPNLYKFAERGACYDKGLFACPLPSNDDMMSICEDFKDPDCASDRLFSDLFYYPCQGMDPCEMVTCPPIDPDCDMIEYVLGECCPVCAPKPQLLEGDVCLRTCDEANFNNPPSVRGTCSEGLTCSEAPPDNWVTVFDTGSEMGRTYGPHYVDRNEWEMMFSQSETRIIRRICPFCAPSHQRIYYRQLTKTVDLGYSGLHDLLLENWRVDVESVDPCIDDKEFDSGYGGCSTYEVGGDNHAFCIPDGALGVCCGCDVGNVSGSDSGSSSGVAQTDEDDDGSGGEDTGLHRFQIDFALFSTYDDAVNFENAWTFCDGNVPGVGFPYNCGPTGPVENQWNAMFFYSSPGGPGPGPGPVSGPGGPGGPSFFGQQSYKFEMDIPDFIGDPCRTPDTCIPEVPVICEDPETGEFYNVFERWTRDSCTHCRCEDIDNSGQVVCEDYSVNCYPVADDCLHVVTYEDTCCPYCLDRLEGEVCYQECFDYVNDQSEYCRPGLVCAAPPSESPTFGPFTQAPTGTSPPPTPTAPPTWVTRSPTEVPTRPPTRPPTTGPPSTAAPTWRPRPTSGPVYTAYGLPQAGYGETSGLPHYTAHGLPQAGYGETSGSFNPYFGDEEYELFLKNCPAFAAVEREQFLTDRDVETICLEFKNLEACATDEIAPDFFRGLCGEDDFLKNCPAFAKFMEASYSAFMTSLESEIICSEFKNKAACADDQTAQHILSQVCADWSPTFEVCDNLREYVEEQGCFDRKNFFTCNEPSGDDLDYICEDFKISACSTDPLFSSIFGFQCQAPTPCKVVETCVPEISSPAPTPSPTWLSPSPTKAPTLACPQACITCQDGSLRCPDENCVTEPCPDGCDLRVDSADIPKHHLSEFEIYNSFVTIVFQQALEWGKSTPNLVGMEDCDEKFSWTSSPSIDPCDYLEWTGVVRINDLLSCGFTIMETDKPELRVARVDLAMKSSRQVDAKLVGSEGVYELATTKTTTWPLLFQFQKQLQVISGTVSVTPLSYPQTDFRIILEGNVEDITVEDKDSIKVDIAAELELPVASILDLTFSSGSLVVDFTVLGDFTSIALCDDDADYLGRFPVLGSKCEKSQLILSLSEVIKREVLIVGDDLVPTATIGIFTAVQHPFELVNPILKGNNQALSYSTVSTTGTCYADDDCTKEFEWTMKDDKGEALCTFTGTYVLEFDVICRDPIINCPLDGSETISMMVNLKTENHCPGAFVEINLPATKLVSTRGSEETDAFLNTQTIQFHADVRADNAGLQQAFFTEINVEKLNGVKGTQQLYSDRENSEQGTLLNLFVVDVDESVGSDPLDMNSFLTPSFSFVANAEELGVALSETAIMQVTATIEVVFQAGGSEIRRRFLLQAGTGDASVQTDHTFLLDGSAPVVHDPASAVYNSAMRRGSSAVVAVFSLCTALLVHFM